MCGFENCQRYKEKEREMHGNRWINLLYVPEKFPSSAIKYKQKSEASNVCTEQRKKKKKKKSDIRIDLHDYDHVRCSVTEKLCNFLLIAFVKQQNILC